MTTCPSPDTFLRLLDGQLSEEKAGALRGHAVGCRDCAKQLAFGEGLVRGVAAPVTESKAALKSGLMARLGPQVVPEARRTGSRWLPVGLALAGATAAAVAVIPALKQGSDFTPRGGAVLPAIQREVGIRYYVGGKPLQLLEAGARVSTDAPIVTAYRNVSKNDAYLLSVAIDAAGKVHWLQPEEGAAWAIELSPREGEVPLPETVVLDAPATGPLRIVTLVSPTPVSPSVLVHLDVAQLSQRFPNASIDELTLTVVP